MQGSYDALTPEKQNAAPIEPGWRKHYDSLRSLRTQLLNAKARSEGNASTPSIRGHDGGYGDVSFDREMLEEVEDAIRRIEEGTYGVCERTGLPIPAERLEVVPWTRFSAAALADSD